MPPSSPENNIAYIGLGGNLDHPAAAIRSARAAIAGSAGIQERAFSRLYHSSPMGPSDQPDYVNAVMAIETSLPPLTLLTVLQSIENAHGRVRIGERWGPRTLDLDVLLYGQIQLDTPTLTLPHPGMTEREFVLYPLAEIAPPDLEIPARGFLKELLQHCPRRGLKELQDV